MANASMWSHHDLCRAALCAIILILAASRSPFAFAADIKPWPIRPEGGLKYLDVFDGPPFTLAN